MRTFLKNSVHLLRLALKKRFCKISLNELNTRKKWVKVFNATLGREKNFNDACCCIYGLQLDINLTNFYPKNSNETDVRKGNRFNELHALWDGTQQHQCGSSQGEDADGRLQDERTWMPCGRNAYLSSIFVSVLITRQGLLNPPPSLASVYQCHYSLMLPQQHDHCCCSDPKNGCLVVLCSSNTNLPAAYRPQATWVFSQVAQTRYHSRQHPKQEWDQRAPAPKL